MTPFWQARAYPFKETLQLLWGSHSWLPPAFSRRLEFGHS
jgi:hypothetical protein